MCFVLFTLDLLLNLNSVNLFLFLKCFLNVFYVNNIATMVCYSLNIGFLEDLKRIYLLVPLSTVDNMIIICLL